jgi:hypothetical protein
MVAYRPSSCIRWYRNARASAFINAGSARVTAGDTPLLIGVTTVFLPGR